MMREPRLSDDDEEDPKSTPLWVTIGLSRVSVNYFTRILAITLTSFFRKILLSRYVDYAARLSELTMSSSTASSMISLEPNPIGSLFFFWKGGLIVLSRTNSLYHPSSIMNGNGATSGSLSVTRPRSTRLMETFFLLPSCRVSARRLSSRS